jgi:hypothetical protein
MKNSLVSAALVALALTPVFAQSPPVEPGLTIGFEQRLRNENWNNAMDYRSTADDEREQIRWRTRFWVSAPLGKGMSFCIGLSQETNQNLAKDPTFDDVFFETAYLNFDRLFVKGLSLRVGRQNLTRGEGFMLMDGSSGDGSRSMFFNGFDLAYKAKKSTVELLGISDPYTDKYMPIIHNKHHASQEWNEKALGVYYTERAIPNTTLEGYYFYKTETGDRRAFSNAQYQPDRFLHTVGGRASVPLARGWLAVGELATQTGHQVGGKQISAKGGYGYIKRTFSMPWAPYVQAGFIGLSGTDPSQSTTIGNWDPVFSRWPKWSELYIYSQVAENGVAYWTNMQIKQLEAGFQPSKRLKARVTYNRMGSFHPFAGGPTANFSAGLLRGDNIQTRADFVVNRFMVAHVLYEHMSPGSYYVGRDGAYFFRVETSFLVKTLIPTHFNKKS